MWHDSMEAENAQVISAKQGISLLWKRTTEHYGTIPRIGNGNLSHMNGSLPKFPNAGWDEVR